MPGASGVTFINSATAVSGAGGAGASSLAPSVPTNTRDGDLMIACLQQATSTLANLTTLTPPAGWTFLGQSPDAFSATASCRSWLYYRMATAEPGSYTWTLGATTCCAAAQTTFRGVDGQNPIAVSACCISGPFASASAVKCPDINMSDRGIRVSIGCVSDNQSAQTISSTGSTDTEAYDITTNSTIPANLNQVLYYATADIVPGAVTGASITPTLSGGGTAECMALWTIGIASGTGGLIVLFQ